MHDNRNKTTTNYINKFMMNQHRVSPQPFRHQIDVNIHGATLGTLDVSQLPDNNDVRDQKLRSMEISLKQFQTSYQPLFTENSQLKSHLIASNFYIEERKNQLVKLVRDISRSGEDRTIIKAVGDLKTICDLLEEEILESQNDTHRLQSENVEMKAELNRLMAQRDNEIQQSIREKQKLIEQLTEQSQSFRVAMQGKLIIIERLKMCLEDYNGQQQVFDRKMLQQRTLLGQTQDALKRNHLIALNDAQSKLENQEAHFEQVIRDLREELIDQAHDFQDQVQKMNQAFEIRLAQINHEHMSKQSQHLQDYQKLKEQFCEVEQKLKFACETVSDKEDLLKAKSNEYDRLSKQYQALLEWKESQSKYPGTKQLVFTSNAALIEQMSVQQQSPSSEISGHQKETRTQLPLMKQTIKMVQRTNTIINQPGKTQDSVITIDNRQDRELDGDQPKTKEDDIPHNMESNGFNESFLNNDIFEKHENESQVGKEEDNREVLEHLSQQPKLIAVTTQTSQEYFDDQLSISQKSFNISKIPAPIQKEQETQCELLNETEITQIIRTKCQSEFYTQLQQAKTRFEEQIQEQRSSTDKGHRQLHQSIESWKAQIREQQELATESEEIARRLQTENYELNSKYRSLEQEILVVDQEKTKIRQEAQKEQQRLLQFANEVQQQLKQEIDTWKAQHETDQQQLNSIKEGIEMGKKQSLAQQREQDTLNQLYEIKQEELRKHKGELLKAYEMVKYLQLELENYKRIYNMFKPSSESSLNNTTMLSSEIIQQPSPPSPHKEQMRLLKGNPLGNPERKVHELSFHHQKHRMKPARAMGISFNVQNVGQIEEKKVKPRSPPHQKLNKLLFNMNDQADKREANLPKIQHLNNTAKSLEFRSHTEQDDSMNVRGYSDHLEEQEVMLLEASEQFLQKLGQKLPDVKKKTPSPYSFQQYAAIQTIRRKKSAKLQLK